MSSAEQGKPKPPKYPVREAILRLIEAADPGRTITPTQVAKAVSEKHWRKLLSEVRAEAIRLALLKNVTIFRKGKPVDPENFKGVYRIGPVMEDKNEPN